MAINRFLFLAALAAVVSLSAPSSAESLSDALASAYANNPSLNAARATTRAVDEGVPQALGGYRPTVNAFVTGGIIYFDAQNGPSGTTRSLATGFTITQPIFNGFRTENGVKAAEAAVRASREALRNTEQNTLYQAVEAYMNVIRDSAILELRRSNVRFLNEEVRAARDRLQVGEGTRTDVSQAEAAVAAATSKVSLAEANLHASRGVYEQVIGHTPKNLKPGKALKGLPRNLEQAISASRADHPAILAAVHNADTAAFNVKMIEGGLLPTLSVEGTVQQNWESGFNPKPGTSAQLIGRLSIPIYEGGVVYSEVREAKETLGQRKIEIDLARGEVHAALIAAWGGLEAAQAQTVAARAQIEATQLTLQGVIEEQRVGQRTTLDVLETQNSLVDARVALVQAERDVVVASYAVLSAIGGLSINRLGLKVSEYRPEHHYKQVRDKWIGLRTPDGR